MLTVWHHISSVNEVVLGYSKVGVTVLSIFKSEYFPTLKSGDVNLVPWEISAVKSCNTGTFLEDHVEDGRQDPED